MFPPRILGLPGNNSACVTAEKQKGRPWAALEAVASDGTDQLSL
jgi:hypothetical protein